MVLAVPRDRVALGFRDQAFLPPGWLLQSSTIEVHLVKYADFSPSGTYLTTAQQLPKPTSGGDAGPEKNVKVGMEAACFVLQLYSSLYCPRHPLHPGRHRGG